MTMTKKMMAMAIALPLVLGSASVLAYGGHHGKGEGRGGCGMEDGRKLMQELDLSDAQQQQLKAMRQSKREAMKAGFAGKREQMQAHHQQMQALMLADTFDEAAARTLAQTMVEQQVERRVAMMKSRHEMFSMLTDEQKTRFQQLMSERQAQCEQRWRDAKDQ
ncbi:CpxP family protein [Photobacterium sp. TY1-4]|uniref:CpxP family protein n=1 Tax=Photobacterium sp. TY1-4 TaxID=2899122 RepID=UPI0021C19DD9|nr:CpxP family protein [Photobacterium sp. TY1-4]UXI01469.1 CpxP family protein [Photobacterium sp. TY1-4]